MSSLCRSDMKPNLQLLRGTLSSALFMVIAISGASPWTGPKVSHQPISQEIRNKPDIEQLSRNAIPHRDLGEDLLPPSIKLKNALTPGSTILGVDVSQYQGDINWSQLNSAVSFAVIRTSYGAPDPGQTSAQYADSKFSQNRAAAEQQGTEIGFYHFAYPQYNSPEAEAKCFTDNIGQLRPGEFVVLDFEEWSYTGDVVSWCKTWLDNVQATLGVRPLIYMSTSRAASGSYNWSPVINANYGLWGAQWSGSSTSQPPSTQWSFMAMRQYDDNGSESGISGAVDQDVFYGDSSQLRQYGLPYPTINWVGTLPTQSWYNANEEYPYHADGAGDIICHEIIDGNEVASYHTHDGYVNLVAAPADGWHEIWAKVTDPWGNSAETPHTFGGLDLNGPVITLKAGTPKQWYNAASLPGSIQWLSDEPENDAGIWHYQYQWDSNGYSNWIDNPNQPNSNHHRDGCVGSASLSNGKHTLFVQAQDDVWNGTAHSGNNTVVNLGEFWVDTTAPVMTGLTTSVSSPSSVSSIFITCTASDDLSGVDHISVSVDGNLIGTISGGTGSVTWNASTYSRGLHLLSAVATDAAGNTGSATSTNFTLGNPQPLSSMKLNPTTVISGGSSTGTVSVASPAPAGGISVSLSTSNSSVATTPKTCTIPAGKTSGTFQVSTYGVDSQASVMISATYGNSTKTATLVVKPATLSYLALSPSTVVGGNSSGVQVFLTGQAGPSGFKITFTTSNNKVCQLSQSAISISYKATSCSNKASTANVSKKTALTIVATKGSSSVRGSLTILHS